MATKWMSADEMFSLLGKNQQDILTGKAIVDYVDSIYKTDTKTSREAAHRMAEAMGKQGHAAKETIRKIQDEATRAGFVPEFSYDQNSNQITMRLTRQAGAAADRNKVNIKPITIKLDVGSVKVSSNKGVPATLSLSAQAEEAGAYFATQLENQLEAIHHALQAKSKTSKSTSTAAYEHAIKDATKKAVQSLISHTTHVAPNAAIFSDELYEGDSKSRQLFLQSNLRMAGAINSAIEKVKKQFGTLKKKGPQGETIDIDDEYIARAIQTYIMVAQSSLGEGAARKTLKNRGIEDQVIDVIKGYLGDILNLSNTVNFGSDRSLMTMTISSRGGRENLLGNYGEKSRHAQQGQNFLKKLLSHQRAFKKVFREMELDSEGFYEDTAQLLYTTAQFEPEQLKAAYDKAKVKIRSEIERQVRKKNPKKTEDEIQKIIDQRLNKMFGDFDPSVYDDMSIVRQSTLGELGSYRTRTGKIDVKRYDAIAKEASALFDEKISKLKDGKDTFTHGGKKFSKTGKDDFVAHYIATKVISGLKPSDIQNLNIAEIFDEEGNLKGYDLIADQLVGVASQQVKTVTDQGERNYSRGLSDRVFTEILTILGVDPKVAKNIDFLKAKEDVKSNNAAHRAIGRLSYIFNKTQDKKGFAELLSRADSPISKLIKGFTGDGIQFSETEEALKAFKDAGGVSALYNWMARTEWDNEKLLDLSDSAIPFIYSHTANIADVFDWTKRVQTGTKERAAQMRTAGASGSTTEYKAALEKRYNKQTGRGAEAVRKAQHDIEQIESAIYDKTASSSTMSQKDVKDYIKNQSYKSGSGDTTRHAITLGTGDQYSVNINKFKDAITQYENGHLTEEEFMKTWEGEVDKIRNEMMAAGINPDDIDVVLDPGQIFGFTDQYGDQYSGRLLHLGSIGANKHKDAITGETVYDRVDYASEINTLMRAISGNRKNKKDVVSVAAHDAIMKMFHSAEHSGGALNEAATKRRLGHSASFHTSGISPEQIAANPGDERLIDSGFISAKAMKSLLLDTYDYEDEEGKINEEEYLTTLLTQLNAARNSSEEYKEYFDGLGTFEEKQRKIVDALMDVAKTSGLSGMFNRFPSIDSEAVKNSRLFVSESIKDDDIMMVGAGLAKAINADFDGDTINVILKMLDNLSAIAGDKTETFDRKVIQDVYQMYRNSEKGKKGQTPEQIADELKKADNEFFTQLSGIAAKVNNINIGTFSNMSTRIRNSITGTKYDESQLITDESGNVDYESAKNVAKGLLVKAVGQTLEQDAISSKKVEQRISEKFANISKLKGGAPLSQEEKDQIVAETLNEYEDLINRIISGDFTDDADFLKALGEMGIAKDGKIESLGMKTAVAQIKNLGLEPKDTSKLLQDVLGVDAKTTKAIMESGSVDTGILGDVMKSVSLGLSEVGSKRGFFWGSDQYNRPVATAREFGKGTKDDEYELARLMKYEGFGANIDAVDESSRIFDEHGKIINKVADAYQREIALEQQKIGVATKEASAIKQLGSSWERYSKFVKDKYDIDKAAEDLKTGNFFVASNAALANIGLERTTPSNIRSLVNPYVGRTTGVDERVLRDPNIAKYKQAVEEIARLQKDTTLSEDVKQAQIDAMRKERDAAHRKLINRDALARQYGIESGSVLDDTLRGAIASVRGDYAASIAQRTDKNKETIAEKEAKSKLETLLYATGKTSKEVAKELSMYEKMGLNMGSVANQFGATVGNEIPIATISENGQYLIGGRMDTVRKSQRVSQYDKSVTEDIYTILDYKTHSGGEITAEDISQVLIYQDALQKVQKRLQEADASVSSDELLKVFQVEIAAALSGTGLEKGLEGLLNSFTVQDIETLRRKTTKVESGLVVADANNAKTRAFRLNANIAAPVRDLILGGEWDKYTPAEQSLILAQAQQVTQGGYYAEGVKVPKSKEERAKTKEQAAAQAQRNEEEAIREYNRLLKEQYTLKAKIADINRRLGLATTGVERDSLQKLLGVATEQEAETAMAVGRIGSKITSVAGLTKKSQYDREAEAAFRLKEAEIGTKNRGARTIWDVMGQNIQRTFTRFFDFRLVNTALMKLQQRLRSTIQIMQQLDKAATNIRIVSGMNAEEVGNLMVSYNKLARELGTTTQAVAESSNTWLRQGYDINATSKLIKASTQLSKLGMLDMNASTKVLTSTLKGFKMEASEATSVVDKLTKLDTKFAASAGEIGEAISRTAAIAQQTGMGLDETSAIVTTIMDVTQQSAEMAGTALRTMLSRYGNVKAGSFVNVDDDDTENLNDIEKVLGQIGIRIRSSSTDMRNYGDVLAELSEKWISLTDVEKNAIATAMAGTRQRNALFTLMNNFDKYQDAVKTAAGSEGTSAKKYEAYMESIEYHLAQLNASWESFTQKILDSEAYKTIIKFITFLVDRLPTVLTFVMQIFGVLNSYKLPAWMKMISKVSNPFKKFWGSNIPKFGTMEEMGSNRGLSAIQKKEGKFEKAGKQQAQYTEDFETGRVGLINQLKNITNFLPNLKQSIDDATFVVRNAGNQTNNLALIEDKDIDALINGQTIESQGNQISLDNIASVSGNTVTLKDNAGVYRINSDRVKELTQAVNTNTQKQNSQIGTGGFWGSKDGVIAANGISAAITGAISGWTLGNNGWFDSVIKTKGGSSVSDIEATWQDRAVSAASVGVGAGAGAAIGTAVNPGVGTMIGTAAGTAAGFLTSAIIKYEMHVEELARKDRIDAALKVVESIDNVKDDIDNINNSIKNRADWDAADAADMRKYIGEIEKEMAQSNKYLMNDFYEALSHEFEGQIDSQEKISDVVNNYLNKLVTGTEEESRKVGRILEAVSYRRKAIETYKSQESERHAAYEIINDPESSEEDVSRARLDLKALDEDVNEIATTGIFKSSAVAGWDATQLANKTLEEAVHVIAQQAMEISPSEGGWRGINVRNSLGGVSDEAYSYIIKAIRDAGLTQLLNKQEHYLSDLLKTSSKQQSVLSAIRSKGLVVDDFSEIVTAIKNNNTDKWNDFAEAYGMDAEAFMSYIYLLNSNQTEMENYARRLNISTEELGRYSEFRNVKLEQLSKNTSELIESMNNLGSLVSNIVNDGGLSLENLSTILKDYPWLIKGQEEGSIDASVQNILRNTLDYILDAESGMIQQTLFSDLMGNKDSVWDAYKSFMEKSGISQGDLQALNAYGSIEEAKNEINARGLYEKTQEFLKIYGPQRYSETYKTLLENIAETESRYIDNSITNLQEQKDALASVNDEYKKQIDLIKAREALENAKNEKRRVYRAGVGWTYEVDQEAVRTAKENLENLETNKEQENLQYQIDVLEQAKQIIEDIPRQETLKAQNELLEEWGKKLGVSTDSIGNFIDALNQGYRQVNGSLGDQKWEETVQTQLKPSEATRSAIINRNTSDLGVGVFQSSNKLGSVAYNNDSSSYNEKLAKAQDVVKSYGVEEWISPDIFDSQEHGNMSYSEWINKMYSLTPEMGGFITERDDKGNVMKDEARGFYKEAMNINQLEKAKAVDYTYDESTGTYTDKTGELKYNPGIRLDNIRDDYTHQSIEEILLFSSEEVKDSDLQAKFNDFVSDTVGHMFGDASDFMYSEAILYKGDLYTNIHGVLRRVKDYSLYNDKKKQYASGTLSTPISSSALINEHGLEGIVTPQGTLTSLPAHTGIVPADLTRNLYQLGEVAPNLIRKLSREQSLTTKTMNNVEDNSMNFQNLYATFETDEGFDFQKLLTQARQYVATTKNNRR